MNIMANGKTDIIGDLLWVNPDPTQQFNAQTVELDLTPYTMVWICWYPSPYRCGLYPITGRYVIWSLGTFIGSGYQTVDMRYFTVNNDGIEFENGRTQAFNSNSASLNNILNPVQIWGIV